MNTVRGPLSFFPGEKVSCEKRASIVFLVIYERVLELEKKGRGRREGRRGEGMSRTEGTSSPRLRVAVSAALRVVISLCSLAIR